MVDFNEQKCKKKLEKVTSFEITQVEISLVKVTGSQGDIKRCQGRFQLIQLIFLLISSVQGIWLHTLCLKQKGSESLIQL